MYLAYMMFEGDDCDSRVYGNVFKTRQEGLNFIEKSYYEAYKWYDKKAIKNHFKEILKGLENNEDYEEHVFFSHGQEINYEIHLSNITDLTKKNN